MLIIMLSLDSGHQKCYNIFENDLWMLPIDRPAFFAAQRRIFLDRHVLVWIAGAALLYLVVILMVRFLPRCRLQCRPHCPAAEWRTCPPPAEWRTSAANSQFVYIALIFSSQGLWYTIGTVKMTATSSLYMIPPHTKLKP